MEKYFIGQIIIDNDYNVETKITNLTSSSIEVFLQKKTSKGINCNHWFTEKEFEKRFKIK